MTTPLRRRQVLGLGFAALGTAVAAPAVWNRLQRFPAAASPAGAASLASGGGVAGLELVAQALPGPLLGGPAELLTYNGRSPGPLLEVKAGDQVRLRLRNRLDQPTNLHFHGLHIPPTRTGDNVFLTVPPGGSTDYTFRLAEDHPAGLFYVHPHHHGHSADQVFGGLGGALVVRGDLDRVPEVAAARETVLALKDYASGGMGMGFQINGQAFEPDRINTRVRLGSTEDWLVVNDDVMDPPFHLHVNPFQVISRNGRPESQRRWKHTVLVKAGEEVRLRVTCRDFPGRTVYHCHNLDHGDMGLMGVQQIDGPAS